MDSFYSNFKDFGFVLKKKLFKNIELQTLENEFDKIVIQLKNSGEDINARWGSPLTSHLEDDQSTILHTHNVQNYSSKMLKMIENKRLLDRIESLIGPNILLHHSKLFYKPPRNGAAFPLHQDWSYFPTEKHTMIAAVIHLTDTTETMGCIRLIPKSHKLGLIKKSDGHQYTKKIHSKYKLENATPITTNAGDVLFFHPFTLHGSMPNISNKPRKTILIQVYSGNDRVKKGNNHINAQLVLRGWNAFATRKTSNM